VQRGQADAQARPQPGEDVEQHHGIDPAGERGRYPISGFQHSGELRGSLRNEFLRPAPGGTTAALP
jgi:hypothetical protein